MKTAAVGQGFSPFFWSPGLGICMLMPGVSPRGGGGGGRRRPLAPLELTKKKIIENLAFLLSEKYYADLRKCCPPRLTLVDLQNSLEHTQPHLIIAKYLTLLPF